MKCGGTIAHPARLGAVVSDQKQPVGRRRTGFGRGESVIRHTRRHFGGVVPLYQRGIGSGQCRFGRGKGVAGQQRLRHGRFQLDGGFVVLEPVVIGGQMTALHIQRVTIPVAEGTVGQADPVGGFAEGMDADGGIAEGGGGGDQRLQAVHFVMHTLHTGGNIRMGDLQAGGIDIGGVDAVLHIAGHQLAHRIVARKQENAGFGVGDLNIVPIAPVLPSTDEPDGGLAGVAVELVGCKPCRCAGQPAVHPIAGIDADPFDTRNIIRVGTVDTLL